MNTFWGELSSNKTLWVVVLSGVCAQTIKIILGAIKEKRFNFYWLLGTGGMPSSHSASVTSFAICMGKEFGFSSPLFALGTLFALITMFDAQTWRRSIGFQAKVLNRIVEDLQERKKIEESRLKELVGHTPVEVLFGALVGTAITFLFYPLR